MTDSLLEKFKSFKLKPIEWKSELLGFEIRQKGYIEGNSVAHILENNKIFLMCAFGKYYHGYKTRGSCQTVGNAKKMAPGFIFNEIIYRLKYDNDPIYYTS